jgi:integrase/recombinase XerC
MTDLIAAYAEHLEYAGRAESTREIYVEELRRMDRQLPAGLACACHDELKAWIYTDAHAPATRKRLRATACSFFDWATDPAEPRLDFNPARLLPAVRLPVRRSKPISAEQVADILTRAPRPARDWFTVALCTGARCCEIAALDRDDITVDETLLHGKGARDRWVPTPPLLWALARQLPPGLVAGGLTRQQVSHRGRYVLVEVLGHKGVHMHRLRHAFGTSAYEVRKNLRAVQELLGHASPVTTAGYIAASGTEMREAVAGLPWAA